MAMSTRNDELLLIRLFIHVPDVTYHELEDNHSCT